MAKTRWAESPDTPTIDEAGVPGFTRRSGMACGRPRARRKISSPSSMPRLWRSFADPAVRQRFIEIGQEAWPRGQQTPEALAAQQKAEIEKWWPIIKAADIKAE